MNIKGFHGSHQVTTASAAITDKTNFALNIITILGKTCLFAFKQNVHRFFFVDGSGMPVTAQPFSNMLKVKHTSLGLSQALP
jgi:hypothetical protein